MSCGISDRFQPLSPSERQVAHVLLTRPPLSHIRIHSEEIIPQASFDLHVLGTPPAFILSQDQTLRSILVCRFPVRGNRRVSINSKIKVNSKKYQINVLSGMYQSVFRGACLACPRFVTVSGSQGAEGLGPDARASLRRKKELYQHPACRVKENFQEIFPTRLRKVGTAAMIINITIIHFSVYRRLFSLPEDRRRCSDKKRCWKRNLTNTW